MYKQLIFCLETNKTVEIDWVYVRDTISRFFVDSTEIKLTTICMNSKNEYNSNRVLKNIQKKIKEYKLGETYVIYCIDVDDFETNPNHVREFTEINEFCRNNGYDLVWFSHDVEDVYLGKRISKKDKYKESQAFRKKRLMEHICASSLASTNPHQIHTSNILTVLEKYLTRK